MHSILNAFGAAHPPGSAAGAWVWPGGDGPDGKEDPWDGEPWKAVLPDDVPRVREALQACLLAGDDVFEADFRVAVPGGGVRWLRRRVRMIRQDGMPAGMAGIDTDITGLKEEQKSLENRTDWLLTALRARSDAYVVADAAPDDGGQPADWLCIEASLDFGRIFGACAPVLPGGMLRQSVPAGGQTWLEATWRALCLGESVAVSRWASPHGDRYETTAVACGGRRFAVLFDAAGTAATRRRPGGVPVLPEIAADQTAARARMAQARRLDALGSLASGIAHDFNNVLQGIATDAALLSYASGDAEEGRQAIARIREAARRGSEITGRLLVFTDRGDLHPAPFDPAALVDRLHDVLHRMVPANIDVIVEALPGLPPVMADRGHFETAIVSLAANARDAMPDGGQLMFTAASDHVAEINDMGLTPGAYVRFTVADTGEGMDAATLARAAEPFFSARDPGWGIGLGVSMANGFAEHSGGAFSIESTPDGGTAAHLWLPVADTADIERHDGGAQPDEKGVHGRILLVEDEPMVRMAVAAHLRSHGHTVTPVANGAEALIWLDKGNGLDMIIADYLMPGIHGIAVIGEAQQRRPGLPAILLTGRTEPDCDGPGFRLLRKPVAPRQLSDTIAGMLETYYTAGHGPAA
jgi:signal transduction histidine kinase/CheY-like chemotaxis protein